MGDCKIIRALQILERVLFIIQEIVPIRKIEDLPKNNDVDLVHLKIMRSRSRRFS